MFMFAGGEDAQALAAAHLPVGKGQLLFRDAKNRPALWALGIHAIASVRRLRSPPHPVNSYPLLILLRRLEIEPLTVGGRHLLRLVRQNARKGQGAAGADQ